MSLDVLPTPKRAIVFIPYYFYCHLVFFFPPLSSTYNLDRAQGDVAVNRRKVSLSRHKKHESAGEKNYRRINSTRKRKKYFVAKFPSFHQRSPFVLLIFCFETFTAFLRVDLFYCAVELGCIELGTRLRVKRIFFVSFNKIDSFNFPRCKKALFVTFSVRRCLKREQGLSMEQRIR